MIELAADYRFGTGQQANSYLRHGWASPEADFVWSHGHVSTLTLPAAPGRGALALELTLAPFCYPPTLRHQQISIAINGIECAARRVGGPEAWWLDVPGDQAEGPLQIEMHCPNATSPFSAGAGGDHRRLGARLSRAALVRHTPYPPPFRDAPREIRFGWNETTENLLGDGWGDPEAGNVWALGRRSTLGLPLPANGGPWLAVLDMRPFLDPPHATRQRLAIGQNERLLTFLDLNQHMAVAIPLLPAAGAGSVELQFDNIDAEAGGAAQRHASGKPFAFSLASIRLFTAPPAHAPGTCVRVAGARADGSMARNVSTLTGLSLHALASRFESFGNGCAFGLVQQQLGYDAPGLLRFAAAWQPQLVNAFLRCFAGLGRPDALHWAVRADVDTTWRLIDDVYGLSIPTPHSRFVPPPPGAIAGAGRVLPRLAEKLLEDVAAGEKILTFRIDEATADAAALAMRAALGSFGDAALLWIVDGTESQRGQVERIGHRLMRGYARAVGGQAEDVISVMANSYVLDRLERDG